MRSDSSNAAYVFDVEIDTDRPYSEALMISIASSTSSYTGDSWMFCFLDPSPTKDQFRQRFLTGVLAPQIRIALDVALERDPLRLGEGLDVGVRPTEPSADPGPLPTAEGATVRGTVLVTLSATTPLSAVRAARAARKARTS